MRIKPASPEALAFVDKGFDCWNGGEIDEMADMYAADAEVDTTEAFPDGRVYRGRAEFARFFHEQWDAWEGLRMDPVEVLEAGNGRWIVALHVWGKGRGSGIEIDQRIWSLYVLGRDGKVMRNKMFPSKEAAVVAAEDGEKEG